MIQKHHRRRKNAPIYFISYLFYFLGCSNKNDKNKFYKIEGYNFHFDLSEIKISTEKPVYLHVNGATYEKVENVL